MSSAELESTRKRLASVTEAATQFESRNVALMKENTRLRAEVGNIEKALEIQKQIVRDHLLHSATSETALVEEILALRKTIAELES